MPNCHRTSFFWPRAALAAAATACCMATATAAPVSMSGAVLIAAPASVMNNVSTDNTSVQVFVETALTLVTALEVDAIGPGTYTSATPTAVGSIASGTAVESYFLSGDGTGNTAVRFQGSITFDSDVLGMLYLNGNSTSRLHRSDAVFGLAGTSYDSTSNFNALYDGGADRLVLSADRRTVTFDFFVSEYQDQVRIITGPTPAALGVPEPGTLLLAATALLPLLNVRRRKSGAA